MSGFRSFTLGEAVTFTLPSEHPDPTLRIDHVLLPLDDLVMIEADGKRLKNKVELRKIAELADTLRTTEQLRPLRVMPIRFDDDTVSLVILTGLRTAKALRLAGRTHARCELLPANSRHLGRAISDRKELFIRERELQRLYEDDDGAIESAKAIQNR